MKRLQCELVKLQDWVKDKGLSVIIVCEERDAAGKGGVIKRITECVSPRTNCYDDQDTLEDRKFIPGEGLNRKHILGFAHLKQSITLKLALSARQEA